MPMNVGKIRLDALIFSSEKALGRVIRVFDNKNNKWIGGHNRFVKLPSYTKDQYILYIEGGQGALESITSSDDLNEIKIYIRGIETGSAYYRS
jgi:hypothetical protein